MGFFHVRFGNPQPTQQLAQTHQIGSRLVRRMQIRLGHHLDQRHTAAIHVDQADIPFILRLPGILFHVKIVNMAANLPPVIHQKIQVSAAADRHIILGDLIPPREIGIQIILPIEERVHINMGIHGQTKNQRLFHHRFIRARQRPRLTGAGRTDIGIRGIPPGIRLAAAEGFRYRVQLDMGLKPDYHFIISHRLFLPLAKHCRFYSTPVVSAGGLFKRIGSPQNF